MQSDPHFGQPNLAGKYRMREETERERHPEGCSSNPRTRRRSVLWQEQGGEGEEMNPMVKRQLACHGVHNECSKSKSGKGRGEVSGHGRWG